MEPPPPDQCDGLHPQQDLAQCSIPVVYDLSIKHRDGAHKNTLMEALHVRNKPNWYNKGVFQENSSDHPAHQSDQIQPDDAFSNTTVTLSYVSRSHMFSSHQSLSHSLHEQLPPLCVPAINKKLSLQSPYEGNTLVSPQYEKEVDHHENHSVQNTIKSSGGPQSSTQSIHQTESPGPSGKQATSQLNVTRLNQQHAGANSETMSFHDRNEDIHIQNGTGNCVADKWLFKSMKKTTWAPEDINKESKLAGSQMHVVCSGTEELVDLNSLSCSNKSFIPTNGECNGLLYDDTLAPPATSQDKTGDIKYDLQEADANAVLVCGATVKLGEPSEAPAVVEATAVCVGRGDSVQEHCSKHSDIKEGCDVNKLIQAATANMLDYSTEMLKPSSSPSPTSTESDAKTDITQYTESNASDVSLPNCKAALGEKTFERKILPPRSRRGIRLEEIVQCITPSRTRGKSAGSKTQALEACHQEALVSSEVEDCIEKSSSPEEDSLKDLVISKENSDKANKERLINKKSTSNEITSDAFASLQRSTSLEAVIRMPKCLKEKMLCHKEVIDLSPPEKKNLRPASTPKSRQNSSASPQKDLPGKNKYAKTKKLSMKRKRKKHNAGQSSMFSPKEPEIKLKYINYKEEKRDNKIDTFSPYVRLELKDSMCTIINYPEEEKAKLKGKNSSQATQSYSPGAVPITSCLLLGRLSSDSKRRSHLVCCLCGRSANAMDLGDLHGPYYPEGFKPLGKMHAMQVLQDNDRDSDSLCSVKEKKHSQTVTAGQAPSRPSQHSHTSMKETCLIGQRRRWSSDGSSTRTAVPKKPKPDPAADDWYSPPVVPLDSSEYWLHEDCAIWCAGVYLVKGKLYGLEEATKLAQETVCSTCHTAGATLGCYFKGCPNKYHYICAIQSDCVLNEDNFSMRCTRHKNKWFKGSAATSTLESR
ncbi:retinoic acid-induced protein 1-like [Polyodon spathula]|uniref:retinoic acid-induced protein 1-like n=1 Tax=Polyodon spathula TaxID=7913 RepID=UPI001B7E33CB|nr:retinoic acid-induced protein 1-like [Polyodon spathula]